MKVLSAFAFASMLFTSHGASAAGQNEAAAFATCAWERVPATALFMSKMKAKKRVVYDEPRIDKAGPFMRVYAACSDERAALAEVVKRDEVAYHLLKAIRKSKPDTLSEDTFSTPVFRCEANFQDKNDLDVVPMIWWGYGVDWSKSQLGSEKSVFNNQVSFTTADLAAMEKRGDGLQNMLKLLEQAEKQETVEAETYEEGLASRKAFMILATEGNTVCQVVTPEGELVDA